jgi:hypothetical protein
VRKKTRNYWMTLKENEGYCRLNVEALDPTMWKVYFGRGYGPVIKEATGIKDNYRKSPLTQR